MELSRRVYRLRELSATALSILAVAMAVVLAPACKSAPETGPPVSVAGKSDAELLYQAALVTFREREFGVDSASAQHGIVTSEFERISERLRRRTTARIIRLPGGANGLRVRIDYQRRFGEAGRAVWRDVQSEQLRERAEETELELGRAIEKRYREWRAYRDERTDAGGSERRAGPDAGPSPREETPQQRGPKPTFEPGG